MCTHILLSSNYFNFQILNAFSFETRERFYALRLHLILKNEGAIGYYPYDRDSLKLARLSKSVPIFFMVIICLLKIQRDNTRAVGQYGITTLYF